MCSHNAEMIDESVINKDKVVPGSKVTVRESESGELETYFMVGTQEANPMKNRISDESPFGRALLGKTVSDEIAVEAPVGTLKYVVVDIDK